MILYVDTSALVPLLISEPTSKLCGELWDRTDRVVATRLAHVEATAALAMARRMDRLTEAQLVSARASLDDLWVAVDVIELDTPLMLAAAELAVLHGLRGYDAVHCASAATVDDAEAVAASGDQRLLAAWRAEGLSVVDVNA